MTTVRKLQDDVCARLRAVPELAGAACVPAADGGAGDIARRVEAALAAAGRAALIVGVPGGTLRRNAAGLAWLDPAEVSVTAVTRPLPRAAGAPARTPEDLALLAAAALAGWTPPGCGAPLSAHGGLRSDRGDSEAAATVTLATAVRLPRLRLPGEGAFAPAGGQPKGTEE